MSGDSKPVLGYWDIRGLAAPIRYLLNYLEVDYEDKHYSTGPAPDYNRDEWLNDKFKLGLSFPNLPYYIDGKVKICQSNAILRHVARKGNLLGDDEESRVRADMVFEELADLRGQWVALVYRTFDVNRAQYENEVLPKYLQSYDEFLGDHDWFAGKKLTYVDFLAYEVLDQARTLKPDCLKSHKNLSDFIKRFEALPQMKAYFSSDKFRKLPFNNKMAKFASTVDA